MDQIYSATYSGVDVYEFLVPTGSVMMRKSDGWVNATHILKSANFPKAKRTRILERDVQVGTHDKVQGGYGKYQGTYVPLERAISIATEFGVEELLRPLFKAKTMYANSSPPPAPKHHHATKNNSLATERAASVRKALPARKAASMPVISNDDSSQKRRGRQKKDSRVSNPNEGVFVRRRLNQVPSLIQDSFEEEGDTDMDDTAMESEAELNENDGLESDIDDATRIHIMDASSPSEFMSDADLANALKSPNQNNNSTARESLERAMHQTNGDTTREKWVDPNSEYIGRLLDHFMQGDDSSADSPVPDFLVNPPKGVNFDQVIDEEGHTIFHWACSMGNPQVVESLINIGCNYRAVNNNGETPLMRAVQFTNAYTRRSFQRLVALLSENMFEFDVNFRTVLHHIALSASSKTRIPAAVQYMEIILAKVSESQSSQRLEEFINLQDRNGDTALHICAKNANKKCIKLLLEYKAKGNIRNNTGRIASDILLENENVTPKVQQRYEMHLKNRGADLENTSVNVNGTTAVAAPHVSEAAIEATHKVAQILMESLQELSSAYDYELQRKESDVAEVQELVSNMNEDIRNTQERTSNHLGEVFDEKMLAEKLRLVEDQVKRHETLVNAKHIKLKRMLERSQKKSLETLVKRFESLSQPSSDPLKDAAELKANPYVVFNFS
ncbi:Transcription factor MBP1 [Cyberlindnera fabianii]|uniref:Transcription factor MBP1 n=1 Tax=Cyberlindnera fabianii TaxID=36022 RepID=A0A1V2L2L6_CYBFA|nr:Transcription factor MBP1 [Cyberlindnera fabianii]